MIEVESSCHRTQVEQERFLVRPSMLGGSDEAEDPGHLTRLVRILAQSCLPLTV